TPALADGGDPPAGGAGLDQIVYATAGAGVGLAVLALFVFRHRTGRPSMIGGLAERMEKASGIPGWAILPVAALAVSLLIAVFGMYWDISIHIDKGRDPGPLANPAHYFILVGLFGVMASGVLAVTLPRERPGDAAMRLPRLWHAPVGGILMTLCGGFALLGFPLDDVWHRIFGQDVTLYSPTHLMLISGASLSTLAGWVLLVEARRTMTVTPGTRTAKLLRANEIGLAGSFLVGLSTFQAEFDYSVPQVRLVFDVVLIMVAAGIGLVAARARLGRGGALAAVAMYLAIRLPIIVVVGPVLGRTHMHIALYIVEALVVEGVWLLTSTRAPLVQAALAGVGIGTIGLAAEWGWSHVWAGFAWPSSMLPGAAILGFVAAVTAALVGGSVAAALDGRPRESRARGLLTAAAFAAMVAAVALTLPTATGSPINAKVTLRELTPAPARTVAATIQLDPPSAAKGAEWFDITAWQGGGSVVDRLRRTGDGTYESTRPIPVSGKWKAILRLQQGRQVLGVPIFLPRDNAIPIGEVPASASFDRPFVVDKKNLQRETKTDAAGPLTTGAYLAVLVLALGVLAALAGGLHVLRRNAPQDRSSSGPTGGTAVRRRTSPTVTGTSALGSTG
ncbi:MAG: hypothetical protein M3Z02_07705, partial [Actinomycetota bacterium]|nr:hypothetical protein [Actinomycetota bacterium]